MNGYKPEEMYREIERNLERRKGDGNDVWVSTEARDHSGLGDVVRAEGGDWSDFMKNPVVMFDHGFRLDLPIGRCPEMPHVVTEGDVKRIGARIDWSPWGIDERIDAVHKLWDGRFLNACSIRFLVVDSSPLPGHEKDWFPPLDIKRWVPREFSVVSIPANQDALRKSFGLMSRSASARRRERRAIQRERRRFAAPPAQGEEREFIFLPPDLNEALLSMSNSTSSLISKIVSVK